MVANITPLPPAPVRGSTEATFSAAANLFVAALPTLVTEINTAGDDIELAITAAQLAETNAELAETNAETAQAAAESARDLAYASSNFKGLWSSLVGALAKPASVAHNDLVWLLLNDLADVTASEPVTGNADWMLAAAPPTSVTKDFAVGANGVTAGNVVELVSDGVQNLQNIYHCEAPMISSLLTLDGANNVRDLALSRLTDTTALAAWNDDTANLGQLAILTAGSPPTMSAVVATSTNDDARFHISSLTSSSAATTYLTASSTNGATRLANISGTNITLSASSAIDMGSATPTSCCFSTSNWLVAYLDSSNDCRVLTAVSNGANAPTLSATLNVNGTNAANYFSLARTSDATAMLVFQNTSDAVGEIAHITGGTTNVPTASTLAHLDGTNDCTYITQSPIDSNHTLCAYNNATTSNGMLAVTQANGTNAPTVISRTPFANSAVSYCVLTSHSATLHSLLYTDSNSDGQHLAVNVDSNYSTYSRQSTLNGTTNTAYNAIAALTGSTAIGAWQEGAGSDGKAATLTLTPTPTISGQLLGISQDTATNGTATIDLGPVWETTNTLVLGEEYFASGAGSLTTNATPIFVGTADTTSSLALDLKGNPAVGLEQVWEITTPGAFTFTVPESGEYTWFAQGAGASGAFNDSGNYRVIGGNAGNYAENTIFLASGSTITGIIGTGGVAVTSAANGNAGTSTSVVVSGISITLNGGTAGKDLDVISDNVYNSMAPFNKLGAVGKSIHSATSSYISIGGPAIFGNTPTSANVSSSTVGVSGINGSGGSGGNATRSGAGGNGYIRITLKRGT